MLCVCLVVSLLSSTSRLKLLQLKRKIHRTEKANAAEKFSARYLGSRRCSWCRLLEALCRDSLVSMARDAVVDSRSCYPAGSNVSLF